MNSSPLARLSSFPRSISSELSSTHSSSSSLSNFPLENNLDDSGSSNVYNFNNDDDNEEEEEEEEEEGEGEDDNDDGSDDNSNDDAPFTTISTPTAFIRGKPRKHL